MPGYEVSEPAQTWDEFIRPCLATIKIHGPKRVIINEHGEATTASRASEEYGIKPDVIFIRKDGWSVGAPKQFEQLAENMWKGDWIGVIRFPYRMAKPYVQQ